MDPSTLPVPALLAGLRAGAVGSYLTEAAVELLIRHLTWLTRPGFVRACICALEDDREVLAVDWIVAQRHLATAYAKPAERAVGLIAVQLGTCQDPAEAPIDAQRMPPLALLLPNLSRADADLVLAAVSHAAGTHDHVDHVGDLKTTGEWWPTATSQRLRLGPAHAWPEPTAASLEG